MLTAECPLFVAFQLKRIFTRGGSTCKGQTTPEGRQSLSGTHTKLASWFQFNCRLAWKTHNDCASFYEVQCIFYFIFLYSSVSFIPFTCCQPFSLKTWWIVVPSTMVFSLQDNCIFVLLDVVHSIVKMFLILTFSFKVTAAWNLAPRPLNLTM